MVKAPLPLYDFLIISLLGNSLRRFKVLSALDMASLINGKYLEIGNFLPSFIKFKFFFGIKTGSIKTNPDTSSGLDAATCIIVAPPIECPPKIIGLPFSSTKFSTERIKSSLYVTQLYIFFGIASVSVKP